MLKAIKRYGIFSSGAALGAVVDYVLTLGGVQLLGLSAEVALGIAMLFSATGVFFWHDHITFRAAAKANKTRRYLKFMAWSGLVFLLRALLIAGFELSGMPLPVALGLAIGVASVINYLLSSRFIFGPDQP